MPLGDHPWGDRGFCVLDPNGVALYVYTEIEPAPEIQTVFSAEGASPAGTGDCPTCLAGCGA